MKQKQNLLMISTQNFDLCAISLTTE